MVQLMDREPWRLSQSGRRKQVGCPELGRRSGAVGEGGHFTGPLCLPRLSAVLRMCTRAAHRPHRTPVSRASKAGGPQLSLCPRLAGPVLVTVREGFLKPARCLPARSSPLVGLTYFQTSEPRTSSFSRITAGQGPAPPRLGPSFQSSVPAVLAATRTCEPSIWPPFHCLSCSRRLSLPCTTAHCYYRDFLGCPLHRLSFAPCSAHPRPGHVQLPLPRTRAQPLSGLPGSGPFLLPQPCLTPLPTKVTTLLLPFQTCFPSSLPTHDCLSEKTDAPAHPPASSGCSCLLTRARTRALRAPPAVCWSLLLRRPCPASLPSLPRMDFASTGSFLPASQ